MQHDVKDGAVLLALKILTVPLSQVVLRSEDILSETQGIVHLRDLHLKGVLHPIPACVQPSRCLIEEKLEVPVVKINEVLIR